jgi:hypothetical protein
MDRQVADEQATDAMEAIEATDATDDTDAMDAIDATEATDDTDTMDAIDATDVSPASSRSGGRRYRSGQRPQPRQQPAGSWPPGGRAGAQVAPLPGPMAAAGSLAGMLAVFLASCLLAAWLHHDALAGLGFCAGTCVIARYGRPEALLAVVVSIPVAFLIAEVIAQLATAPAGSHHGTLLLVLEGTLLTLAGVAPWLFAGTIAGVVIAMFRGLPRTVRQLRADLTGGRAHPRTPVRRGRPVSR